MKSGIIIEIGELKTFENKNINNFMNKRERVQFNINECLNNFVNKIDEVEINDYIKNNVIDVTKLSKEVFPTFDEIEKIDFFISYSYKDVEFVNKLANFLSNLGFKVFADNQNWKSVYELLKKFDNKICLDSDSGYYSYFKRNITTANIYSMLNIALTKVISKSKYFILIESENSITKNKNKYYTNSPWLEYELEMFNLIVPYGNIYSKISKIFTEALGTESDNFKWTREFDIRPEYFSFLKNEDLKLLEKEKKLETIDKCLLENHKKISNLISNLY